MDNIENYKLAAEALLTSEKPLAVVGALDPDAFGACIALLRAMQSRNVVASLFMQDSIDENLQYLLDPSIKIFNDTSQLNLDEFDCVFIPDQSNLGRTPIDEQLQKYLDKGGKVINIDHHIDNTKFGSVNVVDYGASAACVVTYDVIKQSGLPITYIMANAILMGILYDTGNFTNSATNARALEVASECYLYGADSKQVVKHLYNNKPLPVLQLWGEAMKRLVFNKKLGLAVTVLMEDDYKKLGLDNRSTEGLANFFNNMSGVKGVLILRDVGDNKLRGSFRTTRDDLDLGRLAKLMGGGGHRKACGFTVKGKLEKDGNKYKIL